MRYTYAINRELKKLCEGMCLNGLPTLKTTNEYNIPIKALEKWIKSSNMLFFSSNQA